MFDGSDTRYYLSEGNKVIAVEANPILVDKARKTFKEEISSGQLVLVHSAICDNCTEEIELFISGDDLGLSSIFVVKITNKTPIGSYRVKCTTMTNLIERYGHPFFVKTDIEGADKYCILSFNEKNRPEYVSFEADDNIEELVNHLVKIGYNNFKAINQCNFYELNNQESLILRIKRKIIYLLGYKEPRYVKRNGRFFLLGHSSGPAPWASDGKWYDSKVLLTQWKLAVSRNEISGWYDVHAKLD